MMDERDKSVFMQFGDTFILPMLQALQRFIDRHPTLQRIPAIPRWVMISLWVTVVILGVLAGATQ
jgi:hypothetical protein